MSYADGFSARQVDVGHLYGLRWFHLVEAQKLRPALTLEGVRAPWQPGENVATCLGGGLAYGYGSHPEHVPARHCGCGYWAYWKLGQQHTSAPHVVGIVKGYGNVIQGELGFRCSHAKIIAAYIPVWDTAAALTLERDYGVDVYWSLGAMLLRHPAPEGQPKLTDDFYIKRAMGEAGLISGAKPGWGGGQGGWDRDKESALDYARRLGLAEPLKPCQRCGQENTCGTGTYFCGPCKLLEARSAQLATMSGADALRQVHERRESWASGTTVSLTSTYAIGGSGAPWYTFTGGGGGSSMVSGTGYSSGGNGQPTSSTIGGTPVSVSGSFRAKLTKAQMDLINKIFKSGGQD